MARGLQVWSTTAASNNSADSGVNWAEGQAPSTVNDSARAEMASMAMWRDDNNGTLVTSGSTTAYTIAATNQVEGALTAGYTVAAKFHATNDSSATLAVDGLAAKPLQLVAGTNLSGGELLANTIHNFTYSTTGTGQWIKQGYEPPLASALSGQITGSQIADVTIKSTNIVDSTIATTKIADAAITYAKIQNIAASSIVTNPTTSAAVAQAATLGNNLAFTGTALNTKYGPKAWVTFTVSGGVATVAASFNVSGVVRNTTGDYTISFTSNMADSSYVPSFTSQTGTGPAVIQVKASGNLVGSLEIVTLNSVSAAAFDPPVVYAVVFGN